MLTEIIVALALADAFGSPSQPKPSTKMIRVFNAFQLVTLFAAAPYIIGWLGSSPFPYSAAAFWTAIVVYIVLFVGNVICVTESLSDK
jgi:hypothetical protein